MEHSVTENYLLLATITVFLGQVTYLTLRSTSVNGYYIFVE